MLRSAFTRCKTKVERPSLNHPEGGPAVCSSDNGIRRRVRSVWPSGGAHLPQGTGLKRRRRARRRTKGGRIRPDRYAYTTVRPVHPPARTHARTFSCTHARTHVPPRWSITLSTWHTRLGPKPISIWDKAGATLPEDACECARRETRCVAWLRDPDRRTDTAGSMDSRRLICRGWRMTCRENENYSRINV